MPPRVAADARQAGGVGRRGLGRWAAAGAAALALGGLLGGCASMNQITAEVASFGTWPAGRAPGRYAIERLPSQAAGSVAQLKLEAAARAALERAGFQPAASVTEADVVATLGAREGRVLDPWADFNWGWRIGGWRGFGPLGLRHGGSFGWSVGGAWPMDATRDVREVALLLVDRASRQPLIEAHVRYEARVAGENLLPALYEAALQGFPNLPSGERQVTVSLTPGQPAR
jgi:hypothetical protein